MDKICHAVDTFLDHARSTDRPFVRASEFMDQLKADPDWTSDELIQVQTEIIRALMRTQGKNEV
jgi:hypothetical protein